MVFWLYVILFYNKKQQMGNIKNDYISIAT